MGKILFVRHAQSKFNAGETEQFNSDLTSRGHEQARRIGLGVKSHIKEPEKWIGITSPYNRCLQTTLLVWTGCGVRFAVDPRIGESPETIHKRQTTEIIKKEVEYQLLDWGMFGGKNSINYDDETDEAYHGRIKAFLESLDKRRDYLIVSHMTPITHMVRYLCFEGRKEPMTIPNASLTIIEDGKPVAIGMDPYSVV